MKKLTLVMTRFLKTQENKSKEKNIKEKPIHNRKRLVLMSL